MKPRPTRCKSCGLSEPTTVCRLCGTSKMASVTDHPAADERKRREVSRFLAEQNECSQKERA